MALTFAALHAQNNFNEQREKDGEPRNEFQGAPNRIVSRHFFLPSFLSFPFLSFLSSPLSSSPFLFSPLHIFDPAPNSKSSVIGHSKLCTRVERASIETTRAEGTRTIFRLVPSKLQFPRREKDVWWIRTSTTMDKRKKWTEGLTISTRTNSRFRIRSKRMGNVACDLDRPVDSFSPFRRRII